jgi:hypothetical protein
MQDQIEAGETIDLTKENSILQDVFEEIESGQ